MWNGLVWVVLLAVGFFFGGPQVAAQGRAPSGVERLERLLERVRESQDGVRTLRARFEEHKVSDLLLEPVEAAGEFYYQAPDRVRWQYERPDPMVVLIRDGELTTWYQELGEARRLDVGRRADQVLRLLGMGGSVDELLGSFDVVLGRPAEAGEPHRLALTPRYPRIARRIAELTVWIDAERYLPVRLLYVEPNGDRTDFRFHDLRVNESLDQEVFELELPESVRLEDARSREGVPE